MSSLLKRVFSKFSHDTGEQVHDDNGYEIPDPTPIAPPVGYKEQPTLREQMRAMIAEHQHQIEMAGYESEEEANDFDVGDDFEPTSGAELDFNAAETYAALKARESADAARAAAAPKPNQTSKSSDQDDTGTSAAQPPKSPEAPS